MTLISFMAYAAWILLAAFLFRAVLCRFSPERIFRGERLSPTAEISASGLALASFLFMPAGSLPPLLNIPQGGIWFFVCMAGSLVISDQRRALLPIALYGWLMAIFFGYAYWIGLPGTLTNLGTFLAVPVWKTASLTALCGFVLLAAAHLAAGAWLFRSGRNVRTATIVQTFAIGALFATLYLPWNTAPCMNWPDPVAAACDFFLFWLKIFGTGLLFFCGSLYFATLRRLAIPWCAAGTVLLIVSAS